MKIAPVLYISKPSNICVFILICLMGLPVLAQQSDPLLQIRNQYFENELSADQAILDQFYLLKRTDPEMSETPFIKCATPFYSMIHEHAEKLSAHTLSTIAPAIAVETSSIAEETYISPGGKFRIIYETTGTNTVPADDNNSNSIPDYIEWVADAADSSYRHEVINLGFPDPIPAGEFYDVYVRNLSFIYGETVFASAEPSGTFIRIENDFEGFPPNTDPEGDQKGAVKVTMAHEFKHAIQFAQNSWNGDSDRWAEMDATLMEEVVYDTVNDYYNYIDGSSDDLFSSPSTSLIPGSYEDITWALFFHEKFGELFWTEVWDVIEANNATPLLSAVSTVLTDHQSDFNSELLKSYMWHYASGVNRLSGFGFEEASNYPNPRLTETFTDLQTDLSDEYSLTRIAARYFEFRPSGNQNGFFKFNYLVSSSGVQLGLILYKKDGTFSTNFINDPAAATQRTIELSVSWPEIDKLGIIAVNSLTNSTATFRFQISEYFAAEDVTLYQNYPNPFNPSTTIRIELPYPQSIRLDVYDYTGRFIATLADGPFDAGPTDIRFDASNLASGIYLYTLTSEEGVRYQKMTLIK